MTKIDLRPSGVSLHFTKHKANTGEINGLQRHNERTPGGRHGNKNIVDERTKDNIFLIEDDRKLNKRVEDTIAQNRDKGMKGVRKDAVRMVEGTVQLSGKVLDQPEERQVEILKDSFAYLQDTFGKENFVSGVIHLDETHPHLHFDFVPIEDKRLTANTIISPNRLRKYQSDFLKHLQDNNPDLNFQRGTGEHNGLSQKDFERLMGEKARMEKELDDREDELDNREDALDDREDKLNEKVKTLYQDKEKELNDREDKLKQGESDLDEKTKTLWVDQQKLKQDKSDLADREDKVKKREDKVKKREDKVKKTEAEQAETSKKLDKRDDELGKKEFKAIKSMQIVRDYVNDEKKKAKKKENELNDREDAVERREKASDAREKGLDNEVAQRTAERFAEATGMMTEAKRREREADEKDKKADKKLADAAAKEESANKLLESFNNVKERFEQRWNSILEAVRKGALRPDPLENFAKRHEHVKVDDGIDINKMAEDFENQLKALGNNDNQINL